MFNSRYGIEQGVLEGEITQMSSIVNFTLHKEVENGDLEEVFPDEIFFYEGAWLFKINGRVYKLPKESYPKYNVGEIVAVAQSYKSLGYQPTDKTPIIRGNKIEFIEFQNHRGWNNKMFVAPNLMPHEIRITNVRIERLQDISDEDCLKVGVVISEPKKGGARMYYPCEYLKSCANKIGWGRVYHTPREAYAVLIDKVSGKVTWDKNPWVWAYDFELVK